MQKVEFENLISNKIKKLSLVGSEIRKTFMLGQEIKRAGKSVIDFSLGNPDLEPPIIVHEKIFELLNSQESGMHRYMDSAGLVDVREFLAKELSKSECVNIQANSVYMAVGAAGGLQICMRSFLDPGDEVVVVKPYFPEYLSYSYNLDTIPVIVDCDETFQPNISDFEKKLTAKTKVVILNSPNNPSGILYTEKVYKEIFQVLLKYKEKYDRCLPVLSDEPYIKLTYSDNYFSVLKEYPYSFIIRSFSKDIGLAGERIGFIAWNYDAFSIDMIDTFKHAARVAGFVGAPRLMQRLIPHIYHSKVDIYEYQKRVQLFSKILTKGGMKVNLPDAGFFVFPSILHLDDEIFCEYLAQKGVLCVPGGAFGLKNHFRVSLSLDVASIERGAELISELFINKINKL